METNYIKIATQVGDLLKNDTSINEIDRIGKSIFRGVNKDNYPNNSITSQRAQTIYNWVMSLAQTEMNPDKREEMLIEFCMELTPQAHKEQLKKILTSSGISLGVYENETLNLFNSYNFHYEINCHSKELFLDGYFFHAVFEAAKIYNRLVREKSQMEFDGKDLMFKAWDSKTGTLKVNKCETETEMNVQNGLGHLSAGLMSAIRNPTSHEPAHLWPINKEDCLDILAFISFLLRQLDKATYFKQ